MRVKLKLGREPGKVANGGPKCAPRAGCVNRTRGTRARCARESECCPVFVFCPCLQKRERKSKRERKNGVRGRRRRMRRVTAPRRHERIENAMRFTIGALILPLHIPFRIYARVVFLSLVLAAGYAEDDPRFIRLLPTRLRG